MKKTLCLLLALLLCAACVLPAFAEPAELVPPVEGMIPFVPQVADAFGYGADEWWSTSLSRAMFSLLMLLDFSAQEGAPGDVDLASMLSSASFVGKTDGLLCFFGADANYIVLIVYDAAENVACWRVEPNDDAREDVLLEILTNWCVDGYEENSVDDIISCMQILNDVLGDE
ncbi:MAG: hypothetical protein IJS53_00155 [Clostridia bacterium]|nr:hypothetical protein [Clostridia bacterium]